MRHRSFVSGAAVLMGAGLAAKVLGAVTRVLLTRLLGTEGIGLYQMAYPLYAFVLVVAVSGIPVALSRLISERLASGDPAAAQHLFRVALGALFVSGTLATAGLVFGAGLLATALFPDPRVVYSLRSVAPAIGLVAVQAGLRGFFQGHQDMRPTAVSVVVEQVGRVATILLLGTLLLPHGVEYAAAGATFGAVTGALLGLAVLGIWYLGSARRDRARTPGGVWSPPRAAVEGPLTTLARILSLSLPVTAGALSMPVTMAVAAVLVPGRLVALGLSPAAATDLFGQLSGVALTLVAFPGMFSQSLATSLVPEVAGRLAAARGPGGLRAAGDQAAEGLRLAVAMGLPAGVGLTLLAEEVCGLLFASPESAAALRSVAPGTVFLAVQHTTTGLLFGLGRAVEPARNLGVAALLTGVLIWALLPAYPGVTGAGLAIVAGFCCAAVLNVRDLARVVPLHPRLAGPLIVRPALATAGMAVAAGMVRAALAGATGSAAAVTAGALAAGVLAYLALAVLLGVVTREELALLPVIGTPLAGWLGQRR